MLLGLRFSFFARLLFGEGLVNRSQVNRSHKYHLPVGASPRMFPVSHGTFMATTALLLCLTVSSVCQGQLNPVPSPLDVSGKAISDGQVTGDQDSVGAQNPHLTRSWVGDGNTSDSFDYTNSLSLFQVPGAILPDVDALANQGDLLFQRLVNDDATLLASPVEIQNIPGGVGEIYYRTDSSQGALPGLWAQNNIDIGGANSPLGTDIPPEGIDGLEVWGGEDHTMFSLYQDPLEDPSNPQSRKVSVFRYDPGNDISTPYIYNDDVRTAIGLAPGSLEIDLDSLMVFDSTGDDQFDAGDSVLFTVQENQSAGGPFHGGEIWVWNFGSPATFLNHGGVLWDSVNQPAALFGWGGQFRNDIDALEAIFEIPEPSSCALLLLGLVTSARLRRC